MRSAVRWHLARAGRPVRASRRAASKPSTRPPPSSMPTSPTATAVGGPLNIHFLGLGTTPAVVGRGHSAHAQIALRHHDAVHGQGRHARHLDDVPLGHDPGESRLLRRGRHGQEAARRRWRCSPIVTALFANSPFIDGKPSGYLSFRSHIWLNTDPARTGMLPFVFDEGFGFDRYAEYALDVPMYFVIRNKQYINVAGESFRAFMRGELPQLPGEKPTVKDWENHLSTLFPEVRLKQLPRNARRRHGRPRPTSLALPGALGRLALRRRRARRRWDRLQDLDGRGDGGPCAQAMPETAIHTPFRGRLVSDIAREIVDLRPRRPQAPRPRRRSLSRPARGNPGPRTRPRPSAGSTNITASGAATSRASSTKPRSSRPLHSPPRRPRPPPCCARLMGRSRLSTRDVGGKIWMLVRAGLNGRSLASACTIMRSPALKAPSSQSALPSRSESCPSRTRMRSRTSSSRSSAQLLSPSANFAVCRSRIGGSTVLRAANIHMIARALAFPSSGSRPAWRLGDVEHDRTRLEQYETALLVSRDLPERVEAHMRRLLHRFERDQPDVIRLPHLFKRPADAHIAGQGLAADPATVQMR